MKEIPARDYPRPSLKEILDFARGPRQDADILLFAEKFGPLNRRLVRKEKVTWAGSWEKLFEFSYGLGSEPVPIGAHLLNLPGVKTASAPAWSGESENLDFWRIEWESMSAFEKLFAAILEGSGENVSFGIDTPEGFFTGEELPCNREGDVLFILDDNPARRAAARVVTLKLSQYPPLTGFALVENKVMRWSSLTLVAFVWSQFMRLLTGEIEAKKCYVCGEWEIKGEGYIRSSWICHKVCGQRVRQRTHREREKLNDEAWKKSIKNDAP